MKKMRGSVLTKKYLSMYENDGTENFFFVTLIWTGLGSGAMEAICHRIFEKFTEVNKNIFSMFD